MMDAVDIGTLVAAATALLSAGGAWVRLGRVERDVEARVSRELFDVHVRGIEAKLSRIEGLLLYRRRGSGDTDPGVG